MNRRKFLDKSYLGLTTMLVAPETISNLSNKSNTHISKNSKIFAISTWNVPEANVLPV